MEWTFQEIEPDIIHLLLKDHEFAVLVMNDLSEDDFEDETCASVLKIFKKYTHKYNGIPDLEELKTIASTLKINSKKFDILEVEKIYNQMELTPSKIEFIKESIPDFIKNRKFKEAIMETATEIYDTTPENQNIVLDKFNEKFKQIMMYNMDKDIGHNIYDVKKRYAVLKSRREDGIKPKIKLLARDIKGYYGGEIYAYMGETGGGKSIILANDAIYAMEQGKNVVYITLEIRPETFGLRMDQQVANKKAAELLYGQDDVISYLEKKYNDIKKFRKAGQMWIKEFATGNCSASDVERYLEQLKLYENFKADFLVIDYMDIMKTAGAMTGNRYQDQGKVAQEIHALALKLQIPILTAMQANRGSFDFKGPMDEKRVGDSYDKLRILTGAYSINSYKDEDGDDSDSSIMNRYYLYIMKNRNGPAQIKRPFIMNKATMTIHDVEDHAEE